MVIFGGVYICSVLLAQGLIALKNSGKAANAVDNMTDAGNVIDDVTDVGKFADDFVQSPANQVKLENRGSTGRTIPNDVAEQAAMTDALKNPFENINGHREVSSVTESLGDSRWSGWQK